MINYCVALKQFIFHFIFLPSKQQFGSNMTRTSSHGISFSSRIRPVGGSRSNMMASGSRWNVSTVESKSEKSVTHHKPAVQVLKCVHVFMLLNYLLQAIMYFNENYSSVEMQPYMLFSQSPILVFNYQTENDVMLSRLNNPNSNPKTNLKN